MTVINRNIKFKAVPTKPSKAKSIILIIYLLGLYFLELAPMSAIFGSSLYNGLIKPGLWLCIFLFLILTPQIRPHAKLKHRSMINGWAFAFAVIHLVALSVGGLINGFGKSPYSHTPLSIITNLILFGSIIFGRESVRAYVINTFAPKENFVFFVVFALFLAFISIPLNSYREFNEISNLVQFLGKQFAPSFTGNLLANYLAFMGGMWPSLIYYGIVEGVFLLSPILPDPEWITEAFIGILTPIFSYLFMQQIYIKVSTLGKRIKEKHSKEDIWSWIGVSTFSICFIWFVLGVFPVYPSVIATGSMEPIIMPGDVILVEKSSFEDINIDDIVQFKSGKILISHRVIKKIDSNNGQSLITKGDNNQTEDSDPVNTEQIKGKVIHIIPKIGWPTLWLKAKQRP